MFKSNQIALIKSKALRKKGTNKFYMWSLPVETGSNLIRLLMIFLKVIPLSSLDVILDYGELGNFRFIMHSYTILISQGKMSKKIHKSGFHGNPQCGWIWDDTAATYFPLLDHLLFAIRWKLFKCTLLPPHPQMILLSS